MSILERYRKAKVVVKNVNRAFGVVGQGLSGGVLGGSRKTPVYTPERYKPLRKNPRAPKSFKQRAFKVGKKLGDLAVAERKYGYSGPPGFSKAQDVALFGSSGGKGRVEEFYGFSGKKMSSGHSGLKNPHFKYDRI